MTTIENFNGSYTEFLELIKDVQNAQAINCTIIDIPQTVPALSDMNDKACCIGIDRDIIDFTRCTFQWVKENPTHKE